MVRYTYLQLRGTLETILGPLCDGDFDTLPTKLGI